MRFLMTPRPQEVVSRLLEDLETCRCARVLDVIQNMPRETHRADEENKRYSLLNRLCEMLSWCCDEQQARIRKLAEPRTSWLRTPARVLTYDPMPDCMHRLGIWCYMRVLLDILYQGQLQGFIITLFGPALLPSLLKSPTTVGYLIDVLLAVSIAVELCFILNMYASDVVPPASVSAVLRTCARVINQQGIGVYVLFNVVIRFSRVT
jgi:hypothetical protein